MGALYVAEAMWAELLAYVQANPHVAGFYHGELGRRFPRELSALYERLAVETLERKVHRAGYQEACAFLQRMQQLGQEDRVAELVAQWRGQYKQRRALQEELDKAFSRGSPAYFR